MKSILSVVQNSIHFYQCIHYITNSYIGNNTFLGLVKSDLHLNTPVIQLDIDKPIPITMNYDKEIEMYIINCNEMDVVAFLNILEKDLGVYSGAKFLIYCRKIHYQIQRTLKYRKIIDAIFFDENSGEISSFYTYGDNVGIEKLGECKDIHQAKYMWRQKKIPRKFNNTILNICHTFAPPYSMGIKDNLGIELDIQNIILEKIGIKPNFTRINSPIVEKKHLIRQILDERFCDYIIGISAPINNFHFTVPYIYDDLKWYVPAPKIGLKWGYMYQVLNRSVWYAWMVSSMALIMSWIILESTLYNSYHPYSFLKKLVVLYKLFLEQSIRFKPKYVTEIILITICIFCTFMINLIYKCRFFHFLTALHFTEEIDSIDEIMERKMKIGFLAWHKTLFEDNKELLAYLETNFRDCDLEENCSNQAAFCRDIAVLRPRLKMLYWRDKYLDKSGRSLLKELPDAVSDLPWVAAFLPHHPLFPLINEYVHHLLDSGIINKVLSKYSGKPDSNVYITRVKLTLDHMKVPILIWCLGVAVSIVVFVFQTKYERMK